MKQKELILPKLKCKKCGKIWVPRIKDPKLCPNPKCHSLRWDG